MKPRHKWLEYKRPGKGELLSTEELARALGETARTIANWRSRGLVPYIVLGHRSIRYRLEAVLATLDKKQIKGRRRRVFYEQPI